MNDNFQDWYRPARAVVVACVWLLTIGNLSAEALNEAPISDADRDHWSFRPLATKSPPVSGVQSARQLQNPIDAFVLRRLMDSDLKPLPEASRNTLIRRVKFDLLGIPPTVEETGRFVADDARDAYQRIVDRYLASPQCGERCAQHWLDLARFAETDGFEHDKVRPEAWRYRDWVIRALNQDTPYDEFLELQIAGDEIAPASHDAVVATAFCLSGPDMPDINSQEERRHSLLNEMTSTIGSVVLGLQLGCAQCHDHKYDPISHADFYRMRSFFEPAVQVTRDRSVFTLSNTDKRTESFVMLRGDFRRPGPRVRPGFLRVVDRWKNNLPESIATRSAGRRTALADWLTRSDHPLTSRVIVNRIWQQHFGRGLAASTSDFGVMGDEPTHPELLDWLAREFVVSGWSLKWLHRQIVTSATYRRASRATEPNWTEEVRRDAQVAWELGKAADPHNRLLARFPLRRLDGEAIRDAMYAVSDTLNLEAGGPGVMPPLPPELRTTLLKNQWKTARDRSAHHRRSVYVFARRNLRYPIFDAFDRPDANASCPRRSQSTSANQSLLMFNSEQSLLAARRLAGASLRDARGNLVSAGKSAMTRCFSRAVRRNESQMVETFLWAQTSMLRETRHVDSLALPIGYDGQRDDFGAAALVDLCLSFLNSNEFIYID